MVVSPTLTINVTQASILAPASSGAAGSLYNTPNTSLVVTLPSASAGDLVLVAIHIANNDVIASNGVTSPNLGTLALRTSFSPTGGEYEYEFSAFAPVALSSEPITIVLSSASFISAIAVAVTGGPTGFDPNSSIPAIVNVVTAPNAMTTVDFTTTNPGDMLIGICYVPNSAQVPSAGFTIINSSGSLFVVYQVVAAAGPQSIGAQTNVNGVGSIIGDAIS